MKTCNTCAETKATTAFNKRAASKDGLNNKCKSCMADYRASRKEAIAQTNAKWTHNNPTYKQKWRESHVGYMAEHQARYTSGPAAPQWLTPEHIEEMRQTYARSSLWATTGEPYEVDHVIPRDGNKVCGLHVPWNLQILPRAINRKKGTTVLEEDA